MTAIDDIKQMLDDGRINEAIEATTHIIDNATSGNRDCAMAFYLRGNAYRKQGDWRKAMNNYLEAAELDPTGPATMAYNHAQEILSFYHKDFYNP